MYRQRSLPKLVLAAFAFVVLSLSLSVLTAQAQTSDARDARTRTVNVLAAARLELLSAAKAHKVSIQADQIAYINDGTTTIVHAPIAGIRNADFAAGAPVLLVMVKSTARFGIPNGSYVVKAQYRAGATSGRVVFIDRKGAVSAQRSLFIRTWEQSAVLFPTVFTDPQPAEIPNITSVETFWDVHGVQHHYFDCAGVNGVLYFAAD